MSCQSCVAARDAELAAYADALKSAQEKADSLNKPIFILTTPEGYELSETQQPNTVEVKLPNSQ